MAEYNEVYRRARYYDIAFRRDVTREVDFLCDLYRLEAGRPLSSMLDIACGPGYHARLFARRGIKTYGLDLRPEMVEFAREEAQAEQAHVEWMASDMRAFTLSQPVDLALTSYDSIDCLATNDEIVDHFRAVARNLTESGIYVFDLTHPRDCSLWNYGEFHYTGERSGISVEIEWAVNRPEGNPLTQIVDTELLMRVNDNGREEVFRDRARERFALPQEYIALAKLSRSLEMVRFYGDYNLDQPFDNSPGARRMIGVLRKVC